ncbi:MAG: dipeptidyl aminopeptidase/acylaminoacyl peptidase, partial [Phenylobacterium sp.]
MRKRRLLTSLKISVLSLLLSANAYSAPLNVESLNNLNKLHNAKVSPDGSSLVYGVKTKTNGKTTANDLYLLSLTAANAAPKQLTSHKTGESSVQWSSTGDALYFITKRSGSRQVWRLKLSGGEAQQVTDLPLDVTDFKLSPDDKKLVLAVAVLPSCGNFKCTRKHQLAQHDKKGSGKVYNKLMIRHWDSWSSYYKTHLFVGQINDKGLVDAPVVDLMPGWSTDAPDDMAEVSFTADAQHVVFSAKAPASDHAWQTNYDLFKVLAEGGPLENLTENNKAWDAKPTFSKDGRFMAYLAMKVPGFEADQFTLMLKDLKTGALKEVSPLWDRSASSLSFGKDNRTIIALARDLGQKSIFEISTNFGDIKKIYSHGYAGNVQVVGDDLYFTREAMDHPKDLYVVGRDGSGLRQVTDVNKDKLAKLDFGQFEQFSFKGWNDETVYGYTVKPVNFEAGKKYPVAFLVHGGPQ